jgi:hypothetical protein
MTKCQALTHKGNPCKNGIKSGATVKHEEHSHYLCGPHFDYYNRHYKASEGTIWDGIGTSRFFNADTCPKPTTEQQPLIEVPQDSATVQAKIDQARDQLYTNVVVFGNRDVRNPAAVRVSLEAMWAKVLIKFPNARDICGGAKGGDFLGAKSAKNAGVPFKLVIPHKDYFDTYHPVSDDVWMQMMEAAQDWEFVVREDIPFHWSMNFKRNAVMAAMGDHFVCISAIHPDTLRKATKGGTAHMLRECVYPKLGKGGKIYWVNANTGEAQWVTFS